MTTPSALSDVPAPVGSTKVDEWGDVGHPDPFRLFTGKVWEVNDNPYTVYIQGTQLADGSIEELVVKTDLHSDDDLSPREARAVAAALIMAADDLERMAR